MEKRRTDAEIDKHLSNMTPKEQLQQDMPIDWREISQINRDSNENFDLLQLQKDSNNRHFLDDSRHKVFGADDG